KTNLEGDDACRGQGWGRDGKFGIDQYAHHPAAAILATNWNDARRPLRDVAPDRRPGLYNRPASPSDHARFRACRSGAHRTAPGSHYPAFDRETR
ncbi:unnamed protein product, partial [Ectocarpus sp. 12 AP-2014]